MNVTTTTQHFVGNKSFERCNFNCSEQQQQQPDDEYLTTMYDVLRYVGWASGFQSAFCRRLSGSLLRRHVTGKNSPFIYLAAWPSAFLTLDFWPALVSMSYVSCVHVHVWGRGNNSLSLSLSTPAVPRPSHLRCFIVLTPLLLNTIL